MSVPSLQLLPADAARLPWSWAQRRGFSAWRSVSARVRGREYMHSVKKLAFVCFAHDSYCLRVVLFATASVSDSSSLSSSMQQAAQTKHGLASLLPRRAAARLLLRRGLVCRSL